MSQKMIREGVATNADGLRVNVKVNEAEMQVTQVEDGLALSKMMLCQTCGIPMCDNITLADESSDSLNIDMSQQTDNVADKDAASNNRPELRMLQNSIEISEQATKFVRAAYLPHVLLTGGYLVSNPNVYNSFERKFAGTWNVGVIVQVPVWTT